MKQFPVVHWKTHDVLKAFKEGTCDNVIESSSSVKRCGETAPFVFWFSVPVQRLCGTCYRKIESEEFFRLTVLRKHYRLNDTDVAAIPIRAGIRLVFGLSHTLQLGLAVTGGQVLLWLCASKWNKSPRPSMARNAHHRLTLRGNLCQLIAV
jgi:hypothetical protein